MASRSPLLLLGLAVLYLVSISSAFEAPKTESVNNTNFASFRSASADSPKKMAKAGRGEYHHYDSYYPHYYGGHHKELDHYLVPILILLGLGVLVMPLISAMMTGMMGNVPVTTLVSGRKRRDATDASETMLDLLTKVEKAFEYIKKLKEN